MRQHNGKPCLESVAEVAAFDFTSLNVAAVHYDGPGDDVADVVDGGGQIIAHLAPPEGDLLDFLTLAVLGDPVLRAVPTIDRTSQQET